MTLLPKELAVSRESLIKREIQKLSNWFYSLKKPDQGNVRRFLKETYDWIKEDRANQRLVKNYFVMYAIGSTLRGEAYNDVDFLMITEQLNRDMIFIEGLEKKLEDSFDHKKSINLDRDYEAESFDRFLMTFIPKVGEGEKHLHLTVQPETPSEEYFKRQDKKPKVIIYRVGKTSGHRCFSTHNK